MNVAGRERKGIIMEKKKKGFEFPHTYVMLLCMVLIMAVLTYVIPAGEYERVEDPNTGRMVINPDNFVEVESNPTKFFDLFKAIPRGMNDAADISFFIFCTGGAFNIMLVTGAITRGIGKLAIALKGREKLMIPLLLFVFSLAGATIGMSEEAIVFIPLGVALARACGYDAMVGMSMITLGCAVGFNSAWMNPFTVGVAQGIAELPTFSGIGLRFVIHGVFLVVTAWYIMRYATKIQKNPQLSVIADIEAEDAKNPANKIDLENLEKLTGRDMGVLAIFFIGLGVLVYGVVTYGWYFEEIAALFVGMGIFCGLVAGFGPSKIATEFVAGAKDIVFGALVVGVARAILIVMQDGMIIDPIVHAMAGLIGDLPRSVSAIGMYFVQTFLDFVVPSGSGQAAATMPIMVPLADVLGITRQTAVLAFQFGDGFTNSFFPTAGTLMACLGLIKVPYDRWVKFMGPLMGIWVLLGTGFVVYATMTNYGPF